MAAPADTVAPPRPKAALGALIGGVGAARTGFIAGITVASLAAEEILGSARWSGAPAAVTIGGSALGTALLANLMARRDRKAGLVAGYVTAAIAGVVAAVAVAVSSFPLLLLSLLAVGIGHGSNHLARYAAADLYPAARRARAIAWIVWAGTIGAVLGPLLLGPSERIAEALGTDGLVGPFFLSAIGFAIAASTLLGLLRTRDTVANHDEPIVAQERPPIRQLLAIPNARLALAAMVISQVVMVLIMTMTPVHIRDGVEGLTSVGWVIGAHTLGMFALAPISGMLTDRLGRMPMIAVASVLLIGSAVMASTADSTDQVMLVVSLFLLGLGWSFGFVAGSALLTDSIPAQHRVRAQGLADSVVWTSAGLSSLSSGLVLEAAGYGGLSLAGAALAAMLAAGLALHLRFTAPARA